METHSDEHAAYNRCKGRWTMSKKKLGRPLMFKTKKDVSGLVKILNKSSMRGAIRHFETTERTIFQILKDYGVKRKPFYYFGRTTDLKSGVRE